MTAPTLHVVQSDVIDDQDGLVAPSPVPLTLANINDFANKSLSLGTEEPDVEAQFLAFLAAGVGKGLRNNWAKLVAERTNLTKIDANRLQKEAEDAWAAAQGEDKRKASKVPLVGEAGFDELIAHGRKCLMAAETADGSPRLYSWQMGPAEIMRTDDGRLVIHPLDERDFAELLDEVANYQEPAGQFLTRSVPASRELVQRLRSRSRSGMLKVLKGIVATPCFTPSGLVSKPGYDLDSALYLTNDVAISDLPEVPTKADVKAAVKLLAHDVFGDAMLGGVSRTAIAQALEHDELPSGAIPPGLANAIALLVTFFVRDLIKGGVPVWFGTKPIKGSGASTLLSVVSTIVFGHRLAPLKYQKNEEALDKLVLSEVREGARALIFDNVEGSVDSNTLALATTSGYYRGRILGQSTMSQEPFRAVVVIAGNRPALSEELADRVVVLDFDPKTSRPAERDFQHTDVEAWAEDHRAEIIRAVMILALHWMAEGKPRCRREAVQHRFPEWSGVVGGILEAAGIDTMNGNRGALVEDLVSSEVADAHQHAVTVWAKSLKAREELHVADLVDVWATSDFVPPRHLRDNTLSGPYDLDPSRVGQWLRKKHGTTFEVEIKEAVEAIGSAEAKPATMAMVTLMRGRRDAKGYRWGLTFAPTAEDAPPSGAVEV